MANIHSKVHDAKPVALLFGSNATAAYVAIAGICERSGTVAEAMVALKDTDGATAAILKSAKSILDGADARKAERSATRLGL